MLHGRTAVRGVTFLGNMDGNNPVAAARVMNFLNSEEGYKLSLLGIDRRHWKMVDGKIKLLQEQRAKDGFPSVQGIAGAHPTIIAITTWIPQKWQDFMLLYGRDQAFEEWYGRMWNNQGRYQIPTYGVLATTPAWTDFQPTGDEIVNNNFTQIVQSDSEREASALFDRTVEDWKRAGGEAATAEMSEKLSELYR
jgi:putative aldouronate transport system substrate-binding protein